MVQVKDLIEELKKMPQDRDVCVAHTEFPDCFIGISSAVETIDEDEDEKIVLLTYKL